MISSTYRYIFLHIPKTASESMRTTLPGADADFFLNAQSVNQILGIPHHEELNGRARAVRRRLQAGIWEQYFKFAFVRNPWDRAVSAWKMLDAGSDFPEFLARIPGWLKSKGKTYDHERWHVGPQYIHTVDFNNRNVLDFIGRFEHLEEDFLEVVETLGIEGVSLAHRNSTQHHAYTEYYNDDSRKLVHDLYRKDIKMFGYTFGGYERRRVI